MRYSHRFRTNTSLPSVAAFHSQASGLAAITPPPLRVEIHRVPQPLSNGGKMEFSLWFGPLPIRWTSIIEEVSETGFTDRQVQGPFAKWVHRHSFLQLNADTTEVVDQIDIKFKTHPLWFLVGLGFVIGLPVLFAYRGWKTRRMLESRPA